MPVFNDSETRVPFVPKGDYIFCVLDFIEKISQGGKTAGADVYDLKIEVEGKGATHFESLIDHPLCTWKIDTLLKCCGVKINKGEAYEFDRDRAASKGVRYVNLRGLRGWENLTVEEYKKSDGTVGTKNKVVCFYTDRQKLPPRVMAEAEPVPFAGPTAAQQVKAAGQVAGQPVEEDDVPF